MKLSRKLLVIALASIISLTGCLYRVDVQQGNRIDNATIEQLKIGMSRRQVEFLLGEPAIIDIYNPDVWHYVFYFRAGDDYSEEVRNMRLHFDGDLLAGIDGDLDLSETIPDLNS